MKNTKQVAAICKLSVRRIQRWARESGKQKTGNGIKEYEFTPADIKAIKARKGQPRRTIEW